MGIISLSLNQCGRKKVKIDYDRTELLLVSRLVGEINVDNFAEAINRYEWKFLRIWVSVFDGSDNTWTVFEIRPCRGQISAGRMTVALSDLPFY